MLVAWQEPHRCSPDPFQSPRRIPRCCEQTPPTGHCWQMSRFSRQWRRHGGSAENHTDRRPWEGRGRHPVGRSAIISDLQTHALLQRQALEKDAGLWPPATPPAYDRSAQKRSGNEGRCRKAETKKALISQGFFAHFFTVFWSE